MIRWMSVAVVVCTTVACSTNSTDPASQTTPKTASQVPSASTFAGVWRSVTPGAEFVRLSVSSTSVEQGLLAARLAFSGIAWEGSGRIQGDSLLTTMAIIGTTAPGGVMVARAPDAHTLRVQMRPTAGAVTDLTFVREN